MLSDGCCHKGYSLGYFCVFRRASEGTVPQQIRAVRLFTVLVSAEKGTRVVSLKRQHPSSPLSDPRALK